MGITVTEFVLFMWATVATVFAFLLQAQIATNKKFIMALVENQEFYDDLARHVRRAKEKHTI